VGGSPRHQGKVKNMQEYTKHNPNLTPKAQELRKNMTKQEKHLWYDYLRSYPVRILRQKVIASFVADFYCAEAKLVIEIDGGQHYTEDGKQYDIMREQVMEKHGLKTIRYTNSDIDKHFDAVCDDIDAQIRGRVASNAGVSPHRCGGPPPFTKGGKENSPPEPPLIGLHLPHKSENP